MQIGKYKDIRNQSSIAAQSRTQREAGHLLNAAVMPKPGYYQGQQIDMVGFYMLTQVATYKTLFNPWDFLYNVFIFTKHKEKPHGISNCSSLYDY